MTVKSTYRDRRVCTECNDIYDNRRRVCTECNDIYDNRSLESYDNRQSNVRHYDNRLN